MSVKNNIHTFEQARRLMAAQIQDLDLKAKPDIFRIEIKLKPLDLLDWLQIQEAKIKIYGANQDNSAAIAGIGEALSVKGQERQSLSQVFGQLRRYLTPQYPYLQWYGGFCFDQGEPDSNWKDFGAFRFVMPRFEIAGDKQKMIFCCNLIGPISTSKRKAILKELSAIKLIATSPDLVLKAKGRFDLPSPLKWQRNVQQVLEGISQRKYAKVVLARKTVLDFLKPVNALGVFKRLQKVTPNSYHFLFQFGSATFLGASPERLYKRQGRMILSDAIAGTVRRGKNAMEDGQLKEELGASIKNNNEHGFVVEAIKDALNPLCKHLKYEPKPSVMSLGNGHHLISRFEGQLKDGIKDEDILKSLHPTPAVAGTPRDKALAVIRSTEGFSRGWYAAPLGYVGLDWVELVVGIRSGLIKGKRLSVYAGAGVVEGSDYKSEWDEIEHKISNFIKVVQ